MFFVIINLNNDGVVHWSEVWNLFRLGDVFMSLNRYSEYKFRLYGNQIHDRLKDVQK